MRTRETATAVPARRSPTPRPTALVAPPAADTTGVSFGHDFSRVGVAAPVLQRQAAPAAAADMTLEELKRTMLRRFGVMTIRAGTMDEQITDLTSSPATAGAPHALPNWAQWSPEPESPLYRPLIEAFEDVDLAFGGFPTTTEILFFNVEYAWDGTQKAWITKTGTRAKFGAKQLFVFKSALTVDYPLPGGRSVAKSGAKSAGSVPMSPGSYPSKRRVIAHELGHGLTEAAMGPTPDVAVDRDLIKDFRRAVGWTAPDPAELFDMGVKAVESAVSAGTKPPPPAAPITPGNWDEPRWIEQSISEYAVKGGPSEDFAESVMAYVYAPSVLRARSPRRYRFLDERKARWLPRLQSLPRIGDFPPPRGDARVG